MTSLSLAALAACQTGPEQTTELEQPVTTSGDCVPGDNFHGAVTPPLPMWTGYTPTPAAGQVLMDVADWRANTLSSGIGFHVAVIADPGLGKLVWGATVPDGKLSSFRSGGVNPQIGNCCLPPPCCRGCCDKFMGPNLLETSLRYVVVPQNGFNAVKYP